LLYRCHGSAGMWWFASTARGRFNLPAPEGTCYFALDRATAVREVLRDELFGNATTVNSVTDRFVSRMRAPRKYRVARVSSAVAQRFGATNALSAHTNMAPDNTSEPVYTASRVWAMGFADAGFDGIRYRSHYTSTDSGIALFGAAGARPRGHLRWPADPRPEPLARVCARKDVQITVYSTALPTSSSLRFLSA